MDGAARAHGPPRLPYRTVANMENSSIRGGLNYQLRQERLIVLAAVEPGLPAGSGQLVANGDDATRGGMYSYHVHFHHATTFHERLSMISFEYFWIILNNF